MTLHGAGTQIRFQEFFFLLSFQSEGFLGLSLSSLACFNSQEGFPCFINCMYSYFQPHLIFFPLEHRSLSTSVTTQIYPLYHHCISLQWLLSGIMVRMNETYLCYILNSRGIPLMEQRSGSKQVW